MTSRYLREIPLKLLHRKIGDEHVTLLQACYDNPTFNEDDNKGYPKRNGTDTSGKSSEYYADIYNSDIVVTRNPTKGHVANDYMHSLPTSRSLPNDITFRSHRETKWRQALVLICFLFVAVAVGIALLVYYLGEETDDSPPTPTPPVIAIDDVEGSFLLVSGPFALFKPAYRDHKSEASKLFTNAFRYKMNSLFMSPDVSFLYNRTQIVHIENHNGQVSLSFIIRLPSRTVVPADIADTVRTRILEGFKGSLFHIKEDTLKLKTNVTKPTVPPSPDTSKCLTSLNPKCMNVTSLDYFYWSLPNSLGFTSILEIDQFLDTHGRVLDYDRCHGYRSDFMCSTFFPKCGINHRPILPCRKYCQDIMVACVDTFKDFSRSGFTMSCKDLPDSEDPAVCRQNPYKPGKCVPMPASQDTQICTTFNNNRTVFPNIVNEMNLEGFLSYYKIITAASFATHCYKHTSMFACSLIAPPCSGRPMPHHYIPPCASLCQAFRDRCEIFLNIFEQDSPVNCSQLPDSPDTSVCIGYSEAREFTGVVCTKGDIPCGNNRCIKKHWICDGFQDCDDNSDEQHCATCGTDEVKCESPSSLCIKKPLSCDGKNHCYMGSDEIYCVRTDPNRIDNTLQVSNDVDVRWEEVCKDGWTSEFSDMACRQMGYKKALATYYTQETPSAKTRISDLKNGSDPNRLQSYTLKGLSSCESGLVVKLVCWEAECGRRPAYIPNALRIVGGAEVRPGTWPWMASLHGGIDEKFFCGGSILNEEWILTAAHCVGGADKETKYWTIKVGNTRRLAYSAFRQVRKPKALFRHPEFWSMTVENDVALIQLERPLALNDYVRAVCLPDALPEPGTRCIASGWGKAETKALNYEPALLQVSLDVTPWDHCKRALKTAQYSVPFNLTKTMFCAGGSHVHDSCQGDSGSPLVCRKNETSSEWYQGGIVSWGVICAHPNVPGVYTNLPMYLKWIHDTMDNNTGKASGG